MAKILGTVTVDGKDREFVNILRTGPESPAVAYVLTGGEIVERFGSTWKLSRTQGGIEPREVSVVRKWDAVKSGPDYCPACARKVGRGGLTIDGQAWHSKCHREQCEN